MMEQLFDYNCYLRNHREMEKLLILLLIAQLLCGTQCFIRQQGRLNYYNAINRWNFF